MPERFSYNDLCLLAESNFTMHVCKELLEMQNNKEGYKKFISLVEDCIDYVIGRLQETPNLAEGMSEDQLTIRIVDSLNALGLQASHDSMIGGHCDINIQAKHKMHWLGEAKKVDKTDNYCLYGGFKQLTTRYAEGTDFRDHGGVIIYFFCPDISAKMEAWKTYVSKQVTDINIEDCAKNSYSFISSHSLEKTGRDYFVRHSPVALYFDPKDRR